MIRTKRDLTNINSIEMNNYTCFSSLKRRVYAFLCGDRDYYVYKYIKLVRKTEYYDYLRKRVKVFWLGYIITKRKKNRLGQRLSIDMGENAFDEGLYIGHTGIIVGSSKIGKNCRLHGQNCIGSKVEIGDNCELWVGAKVIGPCKLGNNVTIGAGAIVVNSFEEDNITLVGVPAKKMVSN